MNIHIKCVKIFKDYWEGVKNVFTEFVRRGYPPHPYGRWTQVHCTWGPNKALAGVWRLKCFLGPLTFCIHRLKCFWGPSTFYIHRLKCFAEYLVRRMNGIKVLTYPLHVWWWWWRLYPQFGWVSGKKNSKWGVISASKKSLQIYAYLPNSFPKQWLGGGVGFRGLVGQRTPFWVFPGNSSKLGDIGVP